VSRVPRVSGAALFSLYPQVDYNNNKGSCSQEPLNSKYSDQKLIIKYYFNKIIFLVALKSPAFIE
jgi:hypothetical protein